MSTQTSISRSHAPTRASGTPTRRRARGLRSDGPAPWLFIAPTLILIGIFFLYPIIQGFIYSFTQWGPFGGTIWVGMQNWQQLLADPAMPKAIGNTLLYTVVSLATIPLSILFTSLLNRPGLRFRRVFQTAFFLPIVTMPAAIAIVWKIMYNGDFGIINAALKLVGIAGPHWLSTPGLAVVAVAIVGVWMSLGMNMIILGAGLTNIPRDLYEAASLDGASTWMQFRSITVPLLTPSIFFVTVMTFIGSLKVFDLMFVMMGPKNPITEDSQTVVYLFYNEAFVRGNQGYAAAIGIALMLFIALITWVQFQLQKKWVHYV